MLSLYVTNVVKLSQFNQHGVRLSITVKSSSNLDYICTKVNSVIDFNVGVPSSWYLSEKP